MINIIIRKYQCFDNNYFNNFYYRKQYILLSYFSKICNRIQPIFKTNLYYFFKSKDNCVLKCNSSFFFLIIYENVPKIIFLLFFKPKNKTEKPSLRKLYINAERAIFLCVFTIAFISLIRMAKNKIIKSLLDVNLRHKIIKSLLLANLTVRLQFLNTIFLYFISSLFNNKSTVNCRKNVSHLP